MRKISLLLAAAGMCLAISGTAMAQDAAAQPAEQQGGCNLHSRTSDAVHAVVDEHGYDFEGFDALCTRLDAENMGVFYSESYGLIGDRSFGLVMVRLYDRSTVTLGGAYSSSITVSANTESETPPALLMHSINDALQVVATDSDTFVESVRAEIAALRTVMRGQ